MTAFPAIEEHIDYISVCPLVRHGERVTNQFNISSHGTTPLTEALWWVTKKLLPLPEKRKLILLITDGEPDSETTAKASIREIERMGIEILDIGILFLLITIKLVKETGKIEKKGTPVRRGTLFLLFSLKIFRLNKV